MFQSVIKVESPIGLVLVTVHQDSEVVAIKLGESSLGAIKPSSRFEQDVQMQLERYFSQAQQSLNLPFKESGTLFQKRVWKALRQIPYGDELTYGTLAHMLESSPRAVGQACRRNPLPLITPCHRVVAKSGLGGFSGQTQGTYRDIKEWLLAHEGKCRSQTKPSG